MDRPIATDPPFFYSSSAIHIDNQFYHNNHHHLQHHGAHHQQQQHHNHQQPSRQPQSAHSMHRDFDQAIPTRAANDSPVGPEGYSISRRGTMGSLHHQRSHERLALDMDLSETRPPSIAGPSTGRSAGSTSSSFAHGHPHHPQNRPHEGHGYDSAVSSPMDVVGSSHTHAHSHGHSQPSASVPTGGLNVQPAQEQPPMDEEPLYVNAKQYYRILKRRVARARLEELHRLSKQRKVSPNLLSVSSCLPSSSGWSTRLKTFCEINGYNDIETSSLSAVWEIIQREPETSCARGRSSQLHSRRSSRIEQLHGCMLL